MKRTTLHVLAMITAFLSLFSCVFLQGKVEDGYEYLWILPLVFMLVYRGLFMPLIKMNKFKITVYCFIFLAWIRCVVVPCLSSLADVYNGVSYISVSTDAVLMAILLVAYELIIASIFLYLFAGTTKQSPLGLDRELKLFGNPVIYALFILIGIALYIFVGRDMNVIQLFVITVEDGERYGDVVSTNVVLLRTIIKNSIVFFFIWVVSYCKRKYEAVKSNFYVYAAIAMGIFNVGLIVGERRSMQLYTAFVVIYILITAFTKHRRQILSLVGCAALGILALMSVYKHFNVFSRGSYLDSVQESSMSLSWLAKTTQSYFYGTQNVAITTMLGDDAYLNFLNIMYDFGRSVFGLSFLLKAEMPLTTEVFNTYIYETDTATGHLLSSIGYGYIYFGALLAPIIVCLNLFVSIKLEKFFYRCSSYEMKYISGLLLIRFAASIFAITPPLISFATNTLFTAGLLYFTARFFTAKKF